MNYKFLKKIKNIKPLSYFMARMVAGKLKFDDRNNAEISDFVYFACSWRFMGLLTIRPSQIPQEITSLLEMIKENPPKILLEIGTFSGGTLYLLSKVADFDAILVSIDLEDGYSIWRMFFYRKFANKDQKIFVLRENSHDLSTLKKVKSLIQNKKVDVLFIDGDHSYEGVKKDFEMYSPLVNKNGLIIFHDIVSGEYERVGGVPKFWNEIKTNYPHKEMINNHNQNGFGIGVINWGSSPP